MDAEIITAEQCRGARAMLNMSRETLAKAAGIAHRTLADFETGARKPLRNNLLAIRSALESAGVEFIPANGGGPGVRLRNTE